MPFEKGNKFGNGRPKGSLNAITITTREILANTLLDEIGNLPEYLKSIKDPVKKIEALSKLLAFVLPKLTNSDILVTKSDFDLMNTPEEKLKAFLDSYENGN